MRKILGLAHGLSGKVSDTVSKFIANFSHITGCFHLHYAVIRVILRYLQDILFIAHHVALTLRY